jgi:hypothetical protein
MLWNMLTPAEQAVAEASGVTMTTYRSIPYGCNGMSRGKLNYQPPQSSGSQ